MRLFLDFLYQGNFLSILLLYSLVYLVVATILLFRKKPTNSALSISIALTLPAYLFLNMAPIPNVLNNHLKELLIQQAHYGVGSNGLVNSILLPCSLDDRGYLRGQDYQNALMSIKTDMKDHLDKTEVFRISPVEKVNIDKSLNICEFVSQFNELKAKEIQKYEQILKINKSDGS